MLSLAFLTSPSTWSVRPSASVAIARDLAGHFLDGALDLVDGAGHDHALGSVGCNQAAQGVRKFRARGALQAAWTERHPAIRAAKAILRPARASSGW
ncbi:MAG: hypothetical protein U1E17_06295 [Geminicoccaceae bacterium]